MKWVVKNKIFKNKMWVQEPREAKAVTVWSAVRALLQSWGPGVWVQDCLEKQGTGEMALWVKCLLSKHKELSLDSQHSHHIRKCWLWCNRQTAETRGSPCSLISHASRSSKLQVSEGPHHKK